MNDRAIAAVRLSAERDASQTGIDKQDSITETYIASKGMKLVATVQDSNISGGINPFGIKPNGEYERPGLGPYLTEPELIDSYDVIVAAYLDRLARSTKYFAQLIEWAEAHGKRVVCLDIGGDQVDFTTGHGKLIGLVVSWLAEEELKLTSMRYRATKTHNKKRGVWGGSRAFYGYKSVCECHHLPRAECDDPTGSVLILHDAHAEIQREIHLRIVGEHPDHTDTPNGEGVNLIVADLNNRGIQTALGKHWSVATVSRMVRNPASMGYLTYQPDSDQPGYHAPTIYVNPETGVAVKPWPEIIDPGLWKRVQDKLDSRGGKKAKRGSRHRMNGHMLTGIIKCPCGFPLYYSKFSKKVSGKVYEYYAKNLRAGDLGGFGRCSHPSIRLEVAEEAMNEWIKANSTEFVERRLVSGSETEHAIKVINDTLAQHMADAIAGRITPAELSEYQMKLFTKRTDLEGSHDAPVYEYVPTGRTLAGEWSKWSAEQQNKYLTDNHVAMVADNGTIKITMDCEN